MGDTPCMSYMGDTPCMSQKNTKLRIFQELLLVGEFSKELNWIYLSKVWVLLKKCLNPTGDRSEFMNRKILLKS